MPNLMNDAPFVLDEIGAAIFCYYEDFELECAQNGIRDPWLYRPDNDDEEWKKERDSYIREREKYIALKLLDEYGWEPFEERCRRSTDLSNLNILLE